MPYSDIIRDGFTCAFGRFYTRGRVERIDGSRLKTMFLPRLTTEANKLLSGSDFVRGQLQHYGVDYDEQEYSGNGTLLLKKVLRAGKCDKVPDHIKELRTQMHTEWLEKLSGEELSGHPEWIMEKYFVDGSGNPDSAKTSAVVGIPYPRHSNYRTGQLRETASRVRGLHQATGLGTTQTIYLGWHEDAVKKAAKNHTAKEAQADQAKADAREEERASKHELYLAKAQKRKFGPTAASPIGQYIVDCEEIEGNWDELADDMTLAIHATSTAGIYQANFNLGIIDGIMMLSSDEGILNEFCARQEHDEDSDHDVDFDSDDEDEDEDGCQDENADEKAALGSKRKAGTVTKGKTTSGRPSKKAKATGAGKAGKYFLRLRSRDSGTGEINPTPEKGTIKFNGPNLSSFTGEASLSSIGERVVFTARKISAVPPKSWDSWGNYSEAAYERARVSRWR